MKDQTDDEPALKFTPVFENISCLFQQPNAWLFDVDMSSAAVAESNFSFIDNNACVCQPAATPIMTSAAVASPRTQTTTHVVDPRCDHQLGSAQVHMSIDPPFHCVSNSMCRDIRPQHDATTKKTKEKDLVARSTPITSSHTCFADATAACGTQQGTTTTKMPSLASQAVTIAPALIQPMLAKQNTPFSYMEDVPNLEPVMTVCPPHISSGNRSSSSGRSSSRHLITQNQMMTQSKSGSMTTSLVRVVDVPRFLAPGGGLQHVSQVHTDRNNCVSCNASNNNTIHASNSALACPGAADASTITFPCTNIAMPWMNCNLLSTHLPVSVPPPLPPPSCADVAAAPPPPPSLTMNESSMVSCHNASQPYACRLAAHPYAQQPNSQQYTTSHQHHHHHNQHHRYAQQQHLLPPQQLSLQQLSSVHHQKQQQQKYAQLIQHNCAQIQFVAVNKPYTEPNTPSSCSISNVDSKDHLGNDSTELPLSPRLTSVLLDVFDPSYTHLYQVPRECVVQLPPARLNIHRLVLCKNYQSGKHDSCPMLLNCKFVHADCDFRTLNSYPVHVNYVWRSPDLCIYPRLPPGEVLHVIVNGSSSGDGGAAATATALLGQLPNSNHYHHPPHLSDMMSDISLSNGNQHHTDDDSVEHALFGDGHGVVMMAMESQRILRTRGALAGLASLGNAASSCPSTCTSISSSCSSASYVREPLQSCAVYDREGTCLQGEQCEYVHCVLVDPHLTRDFKRATRKMLKSVLQKGYCCGNVTEEVMGADSAQTQSRMRSQKSTRYTTANANDDTNNNTNSKDDNNIQTSMDRKTKSHNNIHSMLRQLDKDTPLNTHDTAGLLTHEIMPYAGTHASTAAVVLPYTPVRGNMDRNTLDARCAPLFIDEHSGRPSSVASASTSLSVCAEEDEQIKSTGTSRSSALHITVPLNERARRLWANLSDRTTSLLLRLDAQSTEAEVLCALRSCEPHSKMERGESNKSATGGDTNVVGRKSSGEGNRRSATRCTCCSDTMTEVICNALQHVSDRVELQSTTSSNSASSQGRCPSEQENRHAHDAESIVE